MLKKRVSVSKTTEEVAVPMGNAFASSVTRRRRRRKAQSVLYLYGPGLCFLLTLLISVSLLWRHRQYSSKSITFGGLLPLPHFETTIPNAPKCSSLSEEDIEYTVVTQLSDNRLWMMQYHCERWSHAISMAILTNKTHSEVEAELQQLNCDTSKIIVQTLQHRAVDEYPVNELRNMAISAVTTSHIVYLDIDFWPSDNLYDVLDARTVRHHLANDEKMAIVIPAFQLERQCEEWRECPEKNIPQMPQNGDQLMELLQNDEANTFDPYNPVGHGSTLYLDWIKELQTTGYQAVRLLKIPCIHSHRYEPYLVFRYCDVLPPFQEQFNGYGKNKMTWVMHLLRSGYKLMQLPKAFVVHYPHLESVARIKWNGGRAGAPGKKLADDTPTTEWLKTTRGLADHIFVQFRSWLQESVPDDRRMPFCGDIQDDDNKLWIQRSNDHLEVGNVE